MSGTRDLIAVREALQDALYSPDPQAPDEGAWDRSGPEPRWRQAHPALLRGAIGGWKGCSAQMKIHLQDVRNGGPIPGSGTGKILRAQAEALLWEFRHAARRCPRPLYRGSHRDPGGVEAWSSRRKVAEAWARKGRGKVFRLPRGALGLRTLDYVPSLPEENEWLVLDAAGWEVLEDGAASRVIRSAG